MLAYRDFAPRQIAPGGFLQAATFEPFGQAVAAANAWIASDGVDVVNVETVVLPNLWESETRGTANPSIGTRGDFPILWNQFVRVWYRTPPS